MKRFTLLLTAAVLAAACHDAPMEPHVEPPAEGEAVAADRVPASWYSEHQARHINPIRRDGTANPPHNNYVGNAVNDREMFGLRIHATENLKDEEHNRGHARFLFRTRGAVVLDGHVRRRNRPDSEATWTWCFGEDDKDGWRNCYGFIFGGNGSGDFWFVPKRSLGKQVQIQVYRDRFEVNRDRLRVPDAAHGGDLTHGPLTNARVLRMPICTDGVNPSRRGKCL